MEAHRQKLGHAMDADFEQIPESKDHPAFRMEPTEPDLAGKAEPVA